MTLYSGEDRVGFVVHGSDPTHGVLVCQRPGVRLGAMTDIVSYRGRIVSYNPNTMVALTFNLETGEFVEKHSTSYLHSWGIPRPNAPCKLLANRSGGYFGFMDAGADMKSEYPEALAVRPVEDPVAQGPVVFLAGPIQSVGDWQSEAIKWIESDERLRHVTVACPRTADMGLHNDFAAQVDWESRWLRRAAIFGVVLFWLPKEEVPIPGRAFAQTSRWELSEWKERLRGKNAPLVVGIGEGFSGARYMKHRLGQSHPDMEIQATLEGSLSQAAQYILRRWPKDGSTPDRA